MISSENVFNNDLLVNNTQIVNFYEFTTKKQTKTFLCSIDKKIKIL